MVWECKTLLDKNELLVLLAIADWANDNGEAYPSLSQLAKKCRMSRRGITNILTRIRDKFISWDDNDGGRSIRNQYRLLKDALNSVSPAPFTEPKTVNPVHPLRSLNSEPRSPFSHNKLTDETVNPVPINSEPRSLAINHHKPSIVNTKNLSKLKPCSSEELEAVPLPVQDQVSIWQKVFPSEPLIQPFHQDLLRASCPDLELLDFTLKDWKASGHKAYNITGIISKYKKHLKEYGTPSTNNGSARSGADVHDAANGISSAVPRRFLEGEAKANRNPKRPGESSEIEYLIQCGWTPEQIAGLSEDSSTADDLSPSQLGNGQSSGN